MALPTLFKLRNKAERKAVSSYNQLHKSFKIAEAAAILWEGPEFKHNIRIGAQQFSEDNPHKAIYSAIGEALVTVASKVSHMRAYHMEMNRVYKNYQYEDDDSCGSYEVDGPDTDYPDI